MKTNFKIFNAVIISGSLMLANPVFAARGEGADAVTTTTVPAAPVGAVEVGDINSIQSASASTSKSTNKGKQLATIVTAACAVGAAVSCTPVFGNPTCLKFLAGVAGGIVLGMAMGKSSKTAKATCDGVSVGGCADGSADGSTGAGGNTIDPVVQTEFTQIQDSIRDLGTQGINVDQATGRVTLPDGRVISGSTLGSSAALSSAGIDPAEFKSMMDKIQKDSKAKLAAKGVDNSSEMFGDALGGGGGASAASADSMGAGSGIGQKGLGIDRDPAQVSGMAVNYNGESIGVGPDNLFKMIHRRYDLHKSKGNFIGVAK